MQQANLLVIDEMSMGHKYIFECLDRSLQDVRRSKSLFGGLTVLLAGDLRQTLPVVRHGSREQIVASTLKNSPTWRCVETFKLIKNMRVATAGSDYAYCSNFLKAIGSGKHEIQNDKGPFKIQIPMSFC